MPWRNGLGFTVELLAEYLPDSKEFAWRLSMADVVSDGLFSDFSGYDRTLILLQGAGITLDHNNGVLDVLTEPLQAAQFKGDQPTLATLHNGAIMVLNIMSRRSCCWTSVDILKNADSQALSTEGDILLVYAIDTAIDVKIGSAEPLSIEGRHLLQVNGLADKICWVTGAALVVIRIHYNK